MAEDVPAHKLEYGLGIRWRDVKIGPKGVEMLTVNSEYIEVSSPLDQTRPGGDPPRPWAELEPRYAWRTHNGLVHVAGWVWPDADGRWMVVDFYTAVGNVIQMQIYRHEDWEGKQHVSE